MQHDIANSKEDDDLDETIDAAMGARDIELLVEEQNAALRQQLDTMKKTLSDYITRLEHLQQSHEELTYDKEKNDRELEVLRKATQDGAHSAKTIKHLEEQVHEQMEIIARNEEVIRSSQKSVSQLESEVQRLGQKNIQADELRDQMAEWRHKAEEFEKKANMAERYKQKLESQQSLVREVQNLQYERAELQEQLRSLMEERERSDRTKKAEDELTKMITQSEQHLWDERNQKAQLLKDVTALQEELMRLQAQRTHDEHFIQDLQEQLQHNGGAGTVEEAELSETPTPFNLEDELLIASEGGPQANLPLEVSRLRAENELIRKTVGSPGDVSTLRRELEETRRQRERLQQNFNGLFEKYTIMSDNLQALMSESTDEGAEAFIKLRQELTRLELEFEQARKLINSLETQLGDKSRELLSAQTDLSAVQKDSIEALNELKNTDKLISTSLTSELERQREETSFITNERDALKSQLVDTLLANDKLRKESDENKDLNEAVSPTETDGSEAAKKATEKVEKLRARLIQRNQQLEQSEQERLELQTKLKAAQVGEGSAAQKAASDHIIKNLQRENALIATAWYDLTSRLQSNHVVLQRRHDAPKSWLNKQRQLVNATSRR